MRKIVILMILFFAQFGLMGQAWQGNLLNDEIIVSEDRTEYKNWRWVDSNGVIHPFNGMTYIQKKFIYYPDGRVVERPPLITKFQTWSNDKMWYIDAQGAAGVVSAYGSIIPKFQVLSVIYAPPGERGIIDYGTTTTIGSSNSIEKTFGTGTTLELVLKKATLSFEWNQSKTDSKSNSINWSASDNMVIPGPQSTASGIQIDHDLDVYMVWLNPKLDFKAPTQLLLQWSEDVDSRDPEANGEMDVIPLYGAWLKYPNLMPSDVARRLRREWAGVDGALNELDYATILARNPFSNGVVAADPVRYDYYKSIPYVPPPSQGQPITFTTGTTYGTTSTIGKSATDEYSVSFKWEATIFGFGLEGKNSLTWTNKWSSEESKSIGKSTTLTITPPPYGYNGPTTINVYKDNIFGTWLYKFAN